MKFDVYGCFTIEVIRQDEQWTIHRVGPGRRVPMQEVFIPSEVPCDQIPRYPDDLWHESAAAGKSILRLE